MTTLTATRVTPPALTMLCLICREDYNGDRNGRSCPTCGTTRTLPMHELDGTGPASWRTIEHILNQHGYEEIDQ